MTTYIAKFKAKTFSLSTQFIYILCMILTIDSHYLPTQPSRSLFLMDADCTVCDIRIEPLRMIWILLIFKA